MSPTLSGIRIMVSYQNLSICCCSFLWEDCFFRNRMKWADGKLRSLQKNQLFLCIARSPAFTDFFNISTFEQFFQAAFYGGFAYVRAKCCNIGFFYNAEFLFKHSFEPFRFWYFPILQMFDTVLKIIIPFQYYAQIVSDERCIIACIVMPADGAILQCLIICLLCFFN